MSESTRTVFDQVSRTRVRRARNLRRVGISVLLVFLALGAFNVFGVRSAVVTATGGGYRLTVTYAKMTRGGLATPWGIEIQRPGGFDGPVTLATTSEYLDLFDENGLDPDPSSSTDDGERIIWEFEPPPGDTLAINFDARVGPAIQVGKQAETAVLVDGRPVVSVRYSTGVMP